MAAPEKRKIRERLFDNYRLTILNEDSYEERFSFLLTPARVLAGALLLVILGGVLIYVLVALTPLKQYLVPDFTDYNYREDASYSRAMVDSLSEVIVTQNRYLDNVRLILTGQVPLDDPLDTSGVALDPGALEFALTSEDSTLRAHIAEQDRYSLIDDHDIADNSATRLHLFKPLEGTLSGKFDAETGHYGIDIVAPSNEVVKCVLDGTVILSTYTSDGGNVIQVQHRNNLISVYKHNSVLFQEEGARVKAGESLAVIGNTGDHSDGPHLHFELWLDGVPVNPLQYFVYED